MNSNINQINQNNDELFADLFAYRFALLDVFEDNEREIIIKLKLKLFEMGFIPSAINGLLYSFYNEYNIPISASQINNANVMVYMYNNNINNDNNSNNRNNLLYNTILNILDTINSDVENEDEPEKETLTEEEFQELPIIKITHNHLLDECECSICIDKFELEQDAIKLPCNHLFHKDCIKLHLLNYNDKCPLCRGDTKEREEE